MGQALWVGGALFGLLGLCTASIVIGLPVSGFQLYVYLKHGQWPVFSTLDAIKYFARPEIWSWPWSPQDWLGLHQLLESIPLVIFLVLLVTFIATIWGMMWAAYLELTDPPTD